MSKYFISGIGTEVGKTVVSAVLTEALQADYWKPVQAGDLHHTDSMKVQQWISNPQSVIHPERYRLNTPASPHYAARVDGVDISLDEFSLPLTDKNLIVEGAGGLLVPLNDKDLIIDLIGVLDLPAILVSRNYLGSINHTLLSIAAIKTKGLELAGIVFSGTPNEETEAIIAKHAPGKVLGRIPELDPIDPAAIRAAAEPFKALL